MSTKDIVDVEKVLNGGVSDCKSEGDGMSDNHLKKLFKDAQKISKKHNLKIVLPKALPGTNSNLVDYQLKSKNTPVVIDYLGLLEK